MFWRLNFWLGFRNSPARSQPCGASKNAATDAQPSAAERFRQAFAPELAKIEAQRAAHAQVRQSQAELEARVRAALAGKLSA